MKRALSEQEYVEQNPQFFRRLHQHDGIWWDQIYPGYARPAFKFKALAPKTARPAWSEAWLGYSHCVAEPGWGNAAVPYMVLEGENLREFNLARLGTLKRNRVRKGLKQCEVKEVSDLESCLEEAREVCASHSMRGAATRHAHHVSPSFFIEQAETWRKQMRRDFACRGRSWFGAWREGRLVGYVATLRVEDVLLIEKVKLHTEFLPFCPSDALYFHVLSDAAGDVACRRIFNSAPQRPGLDRFKELFFFKPTPIPLYVSNPVFYRLAMRTMALREKWVAALRNRGAARADETGGEGKS